MVVRPRTGSTRRYRRLRKYIIARDGNRCQKCGSGKSIQAHHVVPLSAGGLDTPGNLRAICESCHESIHGKTWSR